MPNQNSLTSYLPARYSHRELPASLERDDYKYNSTTLAVFPNGRPDRAHYVFITINTNWSFDEMTQALLRAASESDENPTEGYSIIKGLKIGTGPMWHEVGFPCRNPVVEEGNFRDVLRVLKEEEKHGRCVLIADMEGEEVDKWGGLSAEMMG
ncbi:hypothetical protein G7Y79_00012g031960 [Physcia stellaris]|nr:hypothetical protein G7Y79_00012g031960 [Physcia stellaris]